MRLDAVTAEIRPRSDWEAVDLGFALVRRDFWRCFVLWWLALLPPLVVAAVLGMNPILLTALLWWLKPLGSRMVLFQISRRLFGERPSWRTVFREIPRAWVRRFFHRLVLLRLSPWLPVTLAVEDLEGLRGKAYRQRAAQVARRGDSVMMWIYFTADMAALWLGMGLFGLAAMFLPDGQEGPWTMAFETWDMDHPLDLPGLILWTIASCLMLAMSLVDLFMTGAGFGVYVNNRTWLEGWDVELAFKRIGQRLGGLVAVLFALFVGFSPTSARAEEPRPAGEVISEVMAHEDFKVHTVKDRVPKTKSKPPSSRPPSWLFEFARVLMTSLFVLAVAALIGLLAWLVWRYRHVFRMRGVTLEERKAARARVVMGMEVTPESLPADVPGAAWLLWQQGRHQEALGLLYRGAISQAIQVGQVEIRESDTEGDCLRRVEAAGASAHPGYFRGLTHTWMHLAYAGVAPATLEVESLCREWPFVEGRLA